MSRKNKKRKDQEKDKKAGSKGNIKDVLKEVWSFIKTRKFLFFLILFFIILINILALADKFIFQYVIDYSTSFVSGNLAIESFLSILLTFGIIYFAIVITKSVINFVGHKSIIHLESSLIFKIKEKYFNHILKLDVNFHNSEKTGSLISRINRSTGAFLSFLDNLFFQLSPFIVQIIVLIPLFLRFGIWQSVILVLSCLVYLIFSLTISKKMIRDRKIENDTLDKEKGLIADVFMNLESVKYFGKERGISKRFDDNLKDTKKKQIKSWGWWSWISAGNILIIGMGMIALFVVSLIQFSKGTLSLGELTFIYTTYISLIGTLTLFTNGLRNTSRNITDMRSLFQYSERQNNIKDKQNARTLKIKEGNIEFKDITFRYPKGNNVFENFNLKVPKGKTVALVGHSGCGKSSLIKLLYRFYDVQNGEILVDDRNIKNFQQESLRSEMAIVSQEPILFDDTIYNNVLFSNPKASRSEVMKAIKFAQLDKVIKKLPKKEDTIVGERGVKLSGGEKQRVSIARALLANKKVLVLDEATSSLDSETEHDIQQDLQKLMKGKTSIVIAHRLSTIMSADIIVVMEDGKIVEKGTHRELITKGKHYKALWELQKGGYLPEE